MAKQLSADDVKKIVEIGYADPVFFLHFFFPQWYKSDTPWVHLGIIAVITRKTDFILKYAGEAELSKLCRHFRWSENPDDPEAPTHSIFEINRDGAGRPISVDLVVNQYTMVMMPRGFGKTTLINGLVAWLILYQEKKFPVYISETQTHASRQLKNVRAELESNERIKAVFGVLRPEQRSGKSWTDDIIETTTGVVVAARGRGGQIRGLNVNAQRPDCIIIDDVEDKESVNTQEQRDKTKDWAYSDMMPALPRMDPSAYIVAIGTLLHTDALLMTWRRDPDWTSVVLAAVDSEGEPLWPENMPLATIEKTKAAYARAGRLHIFYLEYMNTVRNPEDAKFKKPMLIVQAAWTKMARAMAIDPAISTDRKACEFAIAVVGMEEGGRIHVLDMYGKVGVAPRAQVDLVFDHYRRWEPNKVGIEAIAYQAALVHLVKEEMFRRRMYFEVEKVGHGRQRKVDRVEGILAPRYAADYIVARCAFPGLQAQLLDWPNGLMDQPDVLAMAIGLLDPYAAFAADPEHDLSEDQYEPLDEVYFSEAP